MPDQRGASIRRRDATLVAILAYAGLRPSEASGLRWSDVGERTVLVQRSTEPDGKMKSTEGRQSRSVRLLAPLVADLREWRMAAGRPADSSLVFPTERRRRVDQGGLEQLARSHMEDGLPARRAREPPATVRPAPQFRVLLLAEGRTIHYVAAQLGHSPALTLRTYGHVLAEFAEADRIDGEAEILRARDALGHGAGGASRAAGGMPG